MATPAPACKAALAEATRLWPDRSRASDGIMGDARHRNTPSDHNQGNAFDLTHDPAHGCDAHALVDALMRRKDGRVKYVISNRRIWSMARYGEGWRHYSGTNPHTKHAHVSIVDSARNNTLSWWRSQAPAPSHPPIAPRFREGATIEVPDVNYKPVVVDLGTTDNEGRGNVWVPYPKSHILSYLPQGLRPNADGRYVTPDLAFAEQDGGTVISIEEWFPHTAVTVDLRVVV